MQFDHMFVSEVAHAYKNGKLEELYKDVNVNGTDFQKAYLCGLKEFDDTIEYDITLTKLSECVLATGIPTARPSRAFAKFGILMEGKNLECIRQRHLRNILKGRE